MDPRSRFSVHPTSLAVVAPLQNRGYKGNNRGAIHSTSFSSFPPILTSVLAIFCAGASIEDYRHKNVIYEGHTFTMKILIVEDNEKLAQSLKRGFDQEGFSADYLLDGEAGQRRIEAKSDAYDVIILDVMLPKKDGIAVCRDLRAKNISTPILMLTARDTISDKITGLNVGADDYLIKPFSFDELVARLHVLMRRTRSHYIQEANLNGIRLNPLTRRVFKNEKEVKLTQKEFAILAYFMRNPDRVMNRQEILDHVWDYDFTTFSNLVDVKIKNLRKKVDPKGKIIETVWNVGYRFNKK
jgi:DNA-binding response OmpR family regulator